MKIKYPKKGKNVSVYIYTNDSKVNLTDLKIFSIFSHHKIAGEILRPKPFM